TYVVHRDSQRTPEEVAQYLSVVHALLREASAERARAYFGQALLAEPRLWSEAQREAEFDPKIALAAFDTPQVAIDPVVLARAVRDRIEADPRIEVRLSHEVLGVQGDDKCEVAL